MSETLRAEPASPTELPVVKYILERAATVPLSLGIDQWPSNFEGEVIMRNIMNGGVYLFRESNQEAVGTVDCRTTDEWIWGPAAGNEVYVHKLAILPERAHLGYGRQIIGWVIAKARAEGKAFVKLDCVANNAVLKEMYPRFGFEYVGQKEWAGGSVALFQRALDT